MLPLLQRQHLLLLLLLLLLLQSQKPRSKQLAAPAEYELHSA
jgi:hypothetical protein